MNIAKVEEDIYNKIIKTPRKETESNTVSWLKKRKLQLSKRLL